MTTLPAATTAAQLTTGDNAATPTPAKRTPDMADLPDRDSELTPLAVMLRNMKFWAEHAESLRQQLDALVLRLDDDPSRAKDAAELVRSFLEAIDRSQSASREAAPYMHSKFLAANTSPPPVAQPKLPIPDPAKMFPPGCTQQEAADAYLRLMRGA
jgi:hypothetical protein